MKISELIEKLQEIEKEQGDLNCFIQITNAIEYCGDEEYLNHVTIEYGNYVNRVVISD